MGVPVDRGSPEGVGVWSVPISFCGKDGTDPAADPRLRPLALVPFPDLPDRLSQVSEAHPRYRDALFGKFPCVSTDEEVDILARTICDRREIAVASGKIIVAG